MGLFHLFRWNHLLQASTVYRNQTMDEENRLYKHDLEKQSLFLLGDSTSFIAVSCKQALHTGILDDGK